MPVEPFSPNVRDCREFIEQYKGVDGFKVYGNTDYIYQFIGDYFDGEVDYDPSKVVIRLTSILKRHVNTDSPMWTIQLNA